MQEEFHGIRNADNTATIEWKVLYKWGTINASIWLPSLIELVGIDTNKFYEPYGCYYSAMQGLNITSAYFTDEQGGDQFAYFRQFNASGGGEAIMKACNQQLCWLRSTALWDAITAWRITNASNINTILATDSHAVRRNKFHISRFRLKGKGGSSLTALHLLSTKRHARLTCSVVNALTTAHSCYHLFVGKGILEVSLSF